MDLKAGGGGEGGDTHMHARAHTHTHTVTNDNTKVPPQAPWGCQWTSSAGSPEPSMVAKGWVDE